MIGETLPGRCEKIVHESPLYLDHGDIITCPAFITKNLMDAMDYSPLDDDLLLVSFPKSGQTWTNEILRLILNRGVNDNPKDATNAVFLDMMGVEAAIKMKRPGLIKTHIPPSLKKNISPQKGKYIYVVRNPKDAAVSYFHHTRDVFSVYQFGDGKFEDFFELFMDGPMEFCGYFDHLLSWYPYTKNENVLLVHYEQMKADPSGQILRLAKFMGEEWHKMLLEDNGILESVVDHSSIGRMKKKYETFELSDPTKGVRAFAEASKGDVEDGVIKVKGFVRSGKVGGWRKMFTDEMNKRMNERIMERLMPVCPEYVEMWKEHGVMD